MKETLIILSLIFISCKEVNTKINQYNSNYFISKDTILSIDSVENKNPLEIDFNNLNVLNYSDLMGIKEIKDSNVVDKINSTCVDFEFEYDFSDEFHCRKVENKCYDYLIEKEFNFNLPIPQEKDNTILMLMAGCDCESTFTPEKFTKRMKRDIKPSEFYPKLIESLSDDEKKSYEKYKDSDTLNDLNVKTRYDINKWVKIFDYDDNNVAEDNIAIMKKLIDSGARLDIKNKKGETILEQTNNYKIRMFLIYEMIKIYEENYGELKQKSQIIDKYPLILEDVNYTK